MKTLIKNAIVYTMKEPEFSGSVIIEDDRIAGVFRETPEGSFDRVVDAGGCALLPGFIDAHTHEGMIQGEIGGAGDDINEMSEPITPHLRAIDAINPDDPSLKEGIPAGITLVHTGPGSANVMGGLFAVIRPEGRIVDEMIVKSPSALKLAFGENPKDVYSKNEKEPQTRMAIAAMIREWFYKAHEYMEKRIKAEADPEDDDKKPEFDLKLEALCLALKKEIAVHAHVHRADDIATAIRLSEEFGFRLVLIHATEGHKVADYIAAKKVPCVVGPSFPGREKPEMNEVQFETAAVLQKAGVLVALQSDTYPPLKYFHSLICMAVKHGMDKTEALKAVTINPAQILGLDERFGSIEEGKCADLIIFNAADPLDFYSSVSTVFLGGKEIFHQA